MDKEEPHAGVRYERKDIRLRGFLVLLLGGCCVMAILYFTIWHFFWWQAGVQDVRKESPYPLSPGLSKRLPPEPRLEQLNRMPGEEIGDVNEQLAAKEKILNSYGPTAEKGFVHIPIEQAINAVAGKLPVRKERPTP